MCQYSIVCSGNDGCFHVDVRSKGQPDVEKFAFDARLYADVGFFFMCTYLQFIYSTPSSPFIIYILKKTNRFDR